MNHQITQGQGGPDRDPLPVHVPSRESTTQMQIASAMSVIHALQPYLLYHPTQEPEDRPELDGGAVASATVTFSKACERLDKILEDESRWSIDPHNGLIEALTRSQEAIRRFNEENVLTVQGLRRPSRQFQPQFAISGDVFLAFAGDPSFPGGQIIGRGKTPAEALLDFDAAFHRVVQEQLHFAEQPKPVEPESEPKPPTSRRKKR